MRRAVMAGAVFPVSALLLVCSHLQARAQEMLEHPDEKYSITAASVEVKTTDEGRVSYFNGGVTIKHGSAVITSRSGMAVEARNMAILEGDVRIVDGETIIRASNGQYFRIEKKAHLFGAVDIHDGRQWVEADEVTYYRDTRIAVGVGSVSFKDFTNDLTVEGGRGEYDFENGHGSMTENPLLTAPGEKKILITGQEMEVYREEGRALVTGGVRIYQGEWIGLCDSLVYISREDAAYLIGGPLISESGNKARAEKLKLEFEQRKLRRALLSSGAEAEYEIEEGEKNIVSGDEIIIEFADGKAREVTVNGSGRGTYYLKPRGD